MATTKSLSTKLNHQIGRFLSMLSIKIASHIPVLNRANQNNDSQLIVPN